MTSDSDTSVMFVTNPDGSFSEGLRPGYEFPKQASPGLSEYEDHDPVTVYERHEGLYLTLVLCEFTLDAASLAAQIVHPELVGGYLRDGLIFKEQKIPVYWIFLSIKILFFVLFYGSAILAMQFQKAKFFAFFADVAIFGIMGDACNFIITGSGLAELILRCTAMVYGRFLRRLLLSGQLVF